MGVFRVAARMNNFLNAYLPPTERGEEVQCELTVDSGAAELALPAELVEKLRLKPLDSVWAVRPMAVGTSIASAASSNWKFRAEVPRAGHRVAPRRRTASRGRALGGDGLAYLPAGEAAAAQSESPDKPLLPLY